MQILQFLNTIRTKLYLSKIEEEELELMQQSAIFFYFIFFTVTAVYILNGLPAVKTAEKIWRLRSKAPLGLSNAW